MTGAIMSTAALDAMTAPRSVAPNFDQPNGDGKKLRETFDSFVGETFYGQMLKSLRKSTDKPAYFHGGRAEEIFQNQLDQVLAENLTAASAKNFTGPMFELMQLQRS